MACQSSAGVPQDQGLENVYTAKQIEDMVDTLRTESKASRRNAPGNGCEYDNY